MTPSYSEEEVRVSRQWYQILLSAIAAPSPLNTQPWLLCPKDHNSIDLFLDKRRLLLQGDPKSRQAFLSAGAFLENLHIAACEAGCRTDISFFPNGWPDEIPDINHPIARITLTAGIDIQPDPLYAWLLNRHSDRGLYSKERIPIEILSLLGSSFDQQFTSFGFSADPSFQNELAGYLVHAAEIEYSDPERLDEYLSYVRIGQRHSEKFPDGYGLPGLGLSGFSNVLSRFRIILCRSGSEQRCYRGILVRAACRQAGSVAAFGWIATKGNSRYDQLRAGRAYQRVHLTATSLGVALQPMSAILEPYPKMEEFTRKVRDLIGAPDSHTIQMLCRLGYPKSPLSYMSRRRPLREFLL